MATQTNPRAPGEAESADSAQGADAQAKTQQAADQAKEKAQAAAGHAQGKVREQLDQRSAQLAEQADQQASDLRSVSGALRDQGKDRPAQAVDRVAGYAERAASYLRDTDADSMLADAEEFGRQKPAAVAAGALALGLAASRFLKASSSRRYSARQTESSGPSRPSTAADVTPPVTGGPAPVRPDSPLPPRSGV